MNSVTSIVYKYLDEFSIDFRTESLYEKYKEFSQKINIEDFVQYKDIKNKSKDFSKEIFHVVVCVKVSNDTPFIPFISVLGEDQEGLENMARELQRKGSGRISYNYSSFLEDIEKQQGRKLMRLSFDTLFENHNISISNARIIPQEISKEKLWFEKQEEDVRGDNIDAQVFELLSADGSFAKELARAYFDKFGMRKIYFSIYSMDSDYNGRSFLTRVMLIGTSSRECEFYLKRRLDRIRDFVSCIRTRYTHDLYRRNLWEAMKSAKAAIMSRNMSHNLGSHVMFYIKQKLQSVSKIIDNKVLANIIPGELSDLKTIEQKIKENKDVELPFLVGLGRFINYLQERQDYIATVATDYIPARSTISFKDFIYDELKPDLRYERHYSQNNDAGWKSGNLLLDYIAYSEGYRSCDKIEILFGDFDGHKPKEDSSPDKDFQKLREFNIAVPGGVIGRQALFSIFENIIRNAAKHSERRDDNKLVLQLSLLSKDDNLFKSDNFKCIRNDGNAKYVASGNILREKYKECFDKYHVLRIKIDMPNDSSTVKNLVTKLADSYIEDGHMNENSKGLKEMRISAAWLRGYSIDTEIPANDPPALSIYTEPYSEDNSKVTISYILCIPRPCRVAFIDSNNATDAQNKILAPYGCKVFPDPFKLKNEEDKEEDREKLIDEIANYEIVCMPTNLKEQLCPYISSRYIINEDQTETLLKNLTDSIKKTNYKNEDAKKEAIEDSIGSIYETWFGTTYKYDILKLVVADEKAVENKKTEKETGSLSSDSNVILTETGSVQKTDVGGAVVYSTHFKGLASKSDGPEDYNTWLQNAICIESVTGNNSTARLIRQDEWNKKWKSKLISSGVANVAIFDERIFSSFISRNSVLKFDNVSINDIQKIVDFYKSKEQTDDILLNFAKELANKFGISDDDASDIYIGHKSIEEVINYLEITYHYDVAQKNHERRIWAFDICLSEINPKEIEIVGYNTCIGNHVGEYTEHKTNAAIPIAKMSYDKGNCEVTLCDNKHVFKEGKSEVFDYITIHQGVLDKIYTAFGIKENENEKYKVTNALHSRFSKHVTPEDKKAFLPNFIIHSGRSKPSAVDMPQHQPFVQFAAVDHAVKDCKYTLVELLATAHYEKNNSNN